MSSAGVQLLNAAAATGPGATYDAGQTVTTHGFQAVVTGSPTSVQVNLEGSIDGANWFSLVGVSSGGYTVTANKPVRYVRANLATLTGGTAPTVSAYYAG